MRDDADKVEELLSMLRPPEPPGGLETRVLRGAREALAREAGRDIWTRIWESRPLRVAWGISVSVLVICNVALGGLRAGRRGPAMPPAGSIREGNGELTAIAVQPPLDEDARPLIGRASGLPASGAPPAGGAPAKTRGKENAS